MSEQFVYMDYNATTPLHPEVKKVFTDYADMYGNPSSMYSLGRETRKVIEQARADIADFINAKEDEIIFVGCGSEANNTVLNVVGCSEYHCRGIMYGRNQIITTQIEHPAVIETSKCLQKHGLKVDYLGVDKKGRVNINELKDKISKQTALVSVMAANNEIGTIQDIKTITEIVKEKGTLMHTDAVQAFGKIPLDVKDLNIDFLSFSGHKIYGPKGIGGLYIKQGTPYCPFLRGGHQEKGRRAGTENTLGILTLQKAVEMRRLEMKEEAVRLLDLKNKLKQGIANTIENIKINSDPENCMYNTLNVSFRGVEGESILLYLDLAGIAVSTGSACSSGSLDPSHVILALGTDAELAHGSIRFSLGRNSTEADVDYVLEKLPSIIEKLREMSTVSV